MVGGEAFVVADAAAVAGDQLDPQIGADRRVHYDKAVGWEISTNQNRD